MPFDGITAKCITDELNNKLTDGRIEKAFQTEKDEIVFLVRAKGINSKLLLSASANCARIHLTDTTKENPLTPPVFCMLLRKHIVGGRIIGFKLFDYDRIIQMTVQNTDDFGDIVNKYIIIEIMGRHSNIMILNHEQKIIDSVKHIDFEISSVREVMPGRQYSLPPAQDKLSPADIYKTPELLDDIFDSDKVSDLKLEKYLLQNVKGFSPVICRELCEAAGIEPGFTSKSLTKENVEAIKKTILQFITNIDKENYSPHVFFKDSKLSEPFEFYCENLTQYVYSLKFESMSSALDYFYSAKDMNERLAQRKSELFKLLNNNIGRCRKKIDIQNEALAEAGQLEKYKLYGELVTSNLHMVPDNVKEAKVINYYSESMEEVTVPLDEKLSASRNAKKYFSKYTKAKSTLQNATKQLEEAVSELKYLESVYQMLEMAKNNGEISEIRQELAAEGYIKVKASGKKKAEKASTPKRFKSSEGADIYVGKNNKQNDELTLRIASKNDLWFHVKDIPGSHVIIKTYNSEITEQTIYEASVLAAFHSKAVNSENVPVDYTLVKNVKKPNGAKPGMVIYTNNKTLYVTPDEELVKSLSV